MADRRQDRVPADWFAQLYRADPDPWRFASSEYEDRKFALTLASLPRRQYRSGFEPGCSFGVLTARLAMRCGRLLAADVVPEVVDRARSALADWPHVEVELRAIPEQWPQGPFDLVVLSELGYYFTAPELDGIVDRATDTLDAGGDLVAAHWRGSTDYPLTAEQVHARVDRQPGLEVLVRHEEPEFLLGVWRRR